MVDSDGLVEDKQLKMIPSIDLKIVRTVALLMFSASAICFIKFSCVTLKQHITSFNCCLWYLSRYVFLLPCDFYCLCPLNPVIHIHLQAASHIETMKKPLQMGVFIFLYYVHPSAMGVFYFVKKGSL